MTEDQAFALLGAGLVAIVVGLVWLKYFGPRLPLKYKIKNAVAGANYVKYWLIVLVPVLISGSILIWAADNIPLG